MFTILNNYSSILLGMVGLWQLFILFSILLPVIALISILKNEFTGNNKLVWVLVVLFLPFLGAILYFVIGRSQKIKK